MHIGTLRIRDGSHVTAAIGKGRGSARVTGPPLRIRIDRVRAVAPVLLAATLLAQPASAGDALSSLGDALQVGLPLAAAVCAGRQHRLASYAAGFAGQVAITQGLKYGLGDAPINQRPNGSSHGFPSGHTAAAFSGATDLSLHCAPGNIPITLAAGAAATLVGASRLDADEHDLVQVLAGAALGVLSNGLQVARTPGGAWGLRYDIDF